MVSKEPSGLQEVGKAGIDVRMKTKPATEAGAATPASPDADGDVLVRAEDLRKNYGPVEAVQGVSFTVKSGEILGLLGPNGAGKSTVLRMLVGFQYPDSGRVMLNGKDVFLDGPSARASLGYLPESIPLYAEMEVRHYLAFFARIKGVARVRQEVDRVVELLDLTRVVGRPCGNVSRGYRQRIGLAQALLHDPSVLILDEPTSGLDPNQIQDFRALLRGLGKHRAVLLSTHILPEAMEVCDEVLILNRGKAVATGRPGQLMGDGGDVHWARLRLPRPPTEEESALFALEPEDGPRTDISTGSVICRVRRDLPRPLARQLLRLALDQEWELMEWGSGAAGLETIFRKLTLGDEER
jgi:ABC-2 type transport system ATP-binding protein